MRRLPILAAAALVVSACAGSGGPIGGDAPGGTAADDAWRTASLVDVRTGEPFRIDDLRGSVVVVEAMAIWCSTCHIQQSEARAALETLGTTAVAYISLDVDPNERAADLADYAADEGFDWRFAVAPVEVSRSLAATFGPQVLSPPSTPIIVLDPDGEVVARNIGITSAAALADLIRQHLP